MNTVLLVILGIVIYFIGVILAMGIIAGWNNACKYEVTNQMPSYIAGLSWFVIILAIIMLLFGFICSCLFDFWEKTFGGLYQWYYNKWDKWLE